MGERYVEQSRVTDPGDSRALLDGLPLGVSELAAVVRGLVVHRDRLAPRSVSAERADAEPRIIGVAEMLDVIMALDPAPLSAPRAPEQRLIGHCRTTSVLLCSFLRHHGVRARARAGFSVYYAGGREFYGDHWVVEYWSESLTGGGWLLADAELDDATRAEHGIEFAATDVPRDQLIVAGEAWQRGRDDEDAWRWFGSHPGEVGERYVASQLLRDIACLVPNEPSAFDDRAPADLSRALMPLDALAARSVAG